MSARRFGAGLLVLGIALSASSEDRVPTSSSTQTKPQSGASTVKPQTLSPHKPSAKSKRWYQVGLASWYGTQFQGRRTAGGERFNMFEMTCAHPSLPMGTWLRVTNLKNRRTVFVRVNDRGPVMDGRIVDLSFAAARALGIAGLANVKLEAVRSSDPLVQQEMLAKVQMPSLFAMQKPFLFATMAR
jgi:rare lipoprotein A